MNEGAPISDPMIQVSQFGFEIPTSRQSEWLPTPRKIEIMEAAAGGLTGQEVADKLGICIQTVKNHNNDLFLRFKVKTITQAVIKAVNLGLLDTQKLVPPVFDPIVLNSLTTPERKIVLEVGKREGTNIEIGNRLGLEEQTVKNHMSHSLKKTKAKSRVQLAVFYLEARRRAELKLGEGKELSDEDIFGEQTTS